MTLITSINGKAGISGNAPSTRPKAPAVLPRWLVALLFISLLAAPFGDALGQGAPERPVLLIDIKGAIGFVAAAQRANPLKTKPPSNWRMKPAQTG